MMSGVLLLEGVVEVCDYYGIKLADFIWFYEISLIGLVDGLGKIVVLCEMAEKSRKVIILHVI